MRGVDVVDLCSQEEPEGALFEHGLSMPTAACAGRREVAPTETIDLSNDPAPPSKRAAHNKLLVDAVDLTGPDAAAVQPGARQGGRKRNWGELEEEEGGRRGGRAHLAPARPGPHDLQWGQTGARAARRRLAAGSLPAPGMADSSAAPGSQAGSRRAAAAVLAAVHAAPPPYLSHAAAITAARAGARKPSAISSSSPAGSGKQLSAEASPPPGWAAAADPATDMGYARRVQAEEDAQTARRLLEEERQAQAAVAQERLAVQQHAAAAQQHAYSGRGGGYEAADLDALAFGGGRRRGRYARADEEGDLGGGGGGRMPDPHTWGLFMANALMGMPGYAGGGGGQPFQPPTRRLPAQLQQVLAGIQRAGLPPSLLFSDRDFGADDYELLLRLDEGVASQKGASSAEIAALPIQTVPAGGLAGEAGEPLTCCVCMCEYAEGEQMRTTPCCHRFHAACLETWLRQKACCPVCQRECR